LLPALIVLSVWSAARGEGETGSGISSEFLQYRGLMQFKSVDLTTRVIWAAQIFSSSPELKKVLPVYAYKWSEVQSDFKEIELAADNFFAILPSYTGDTGDTGDKDRDKERPADCGAVLKVIKPVKIHSLQTEAFNLIDANAAEVPESNKQCLEDLLEQRDGGNGGWYLAVTRSNRILVSPENPEKDAPSARWLWTKIDFGGSRK